MKRGGRGGHGHSRTTSANVTEDEDEGTHDDAADARLARFATPAGPSNGTTKTWEQVCALYITK